MRTSVARAALLALALGALAAPVAAQARDYAAEARRVTGTPVDGRPGYVWRHDGHGWLQEATVLSSDPAPCVDPYNTGTCQTGTPTAPVTFAAGACYHGPYSTDQIRVSSLGPALAAGRHIVSAEWIPTPGSQARGPWSFYADAPPIPLFAMPCPAAS
jgi:hypothetical protein